MLAVTENAGQWTRFRSAGLPHDRCLVHAGTPCGSPNGFVGYDGGMTKARSGSSRDVTASGRTRARSTATGRSGKGRAADVPRPADVTTAKAARGSSVGRGRSAQPADDPLSAERTRWLVAALGGGRRLAEILGVSPSQPSRWATGAERPGVRVAPR